MTSPSGERTTSRNYGREGDMIPEISFDESMGKKTSERRAERLTLQFLSTPCSKKLASPFFTISHSPTVAGFSPLVFLLYVDTVQHPAVTSSFLSPVNALPRAITEAACPTRHIVLTSGYSSSILRRKATRKRRARRRRSERVSPRREG